MAGASSVFPNRLAPPLGMGYTTRRKQAAAPGEWPAGKGVFMRVLEQLEPQGVFRFFEELCAIPHGSRNCQAVSDWWHNGQIVLEAEDFDGVDFSAAVGGEVGD